MIPADKKLPEKTDHRAVLWEERSGAPYPGQVYDWWNEADPPLVLTLIGTYSMWTINRTVIRHGINGASLISRGNRLSEVLFLLIDREPACNIQDVRQSPEKNEEMTHPDPYSREE